MEHHTSNNELLPRLEAALASPAPRARLQRLMNELLEKDYERADLIPALEDFSARLAASGRKEEEELILEVIDGFMPWC